MPVDELKTVKDYRDMLAESMFLHALNQRFFKISRRKDPPYFSCSAAADALVRPLKAYIMSSSCKEKGTLEALESMLIEVCYPFSISWLAIYIFLSASPPPFFFPFISICWYTELQVARVRLHGFSEREVSVVRALLMSEIESAYLERDQMQSTSLRDEYIQVYHNSGYNLFHLSNLRFWKFIKILYFHRYHFAALYPQWTCYWYWVWSSTPKNYSALWVDIFFLGI